MSPQKSGFHKCTGGDLLDLLGLNIADQQSGLLGGECGDDGFTDALGGASQQHDFVFQALTLRRCGHRRQGKRFSHGSGLLFASAKKPGI